jgi:hypothetical protein
LKWMTFVITIACRSCSPETRLSDATFCMCALSAQVWPWPYGQAVQ